MRRADMPDLSRLAEHRGGWLGAQAPDPRDAREADYEGADPDIEALRREWHESREAA